MEASSAINTPHPDGDPAEDFFAGEEDEPTSSTEPESAGAGEAQTEPEEEDPTAGEPAESDGQTEEASPVEPESAADPAPADPPPGPEPTTPPGGESAAEADKTRGAAEREYIVFQRLALTEKVLKGLLKEIEHGDAPKPRVVFVELNRATTRNDRQAISHTYRTNREALGDECDLAAVSSRSFKQRHVKPREVTPQDEIQIS